MPGTFKVQGDMFPAFWFVNFMRKFIFMTSCFAGFLRNE